MSELRDARAKLPDLAQHYARAGWPIFPLKGKAPAIETAHPKGDPLQGQCGGECGRDGHGMKDATTDPATITRWWTERPGANIGLRPLPNVTVLDVDPRAGGAETMHKLVAEHGLLPSTLAVLSGRGDGGRHYYWHTPPGRPLVVTELRRRYGPGIDLKGHGGYVVAAGSIHPDTGGIYVKQPGIQRPVPMPRWLYALLTPPAAPERTAPRVVALRGGPSVADEYSANATWPDVLTPHGWRCVGGDGNSDGSKWKHPAATSSCSATVRNGCLFVYTANTPLPVTEAGNPKGVTKFRAYALLNHHGDLSAAARALRDYLQRAA